jgi:hypothetical protein
LTGTRIIEIKTIQAYSGLLNKSSEILYEKKDKIKGGIMPSNRIKKWLNNILPFSSSDLALK